MFLSAIALHGLLSMMIETAATERVIQNAIRRADAASAEADRLIEKYKKEQQQKKKP